jgi:Tol biopolymer transport system component
LSAAISIGQTANESAVVVTVPLHHTEARPSDPSCVSVSADGRFIAFASAARLVPEDTDDRDDIYVLDRESGVVSFESDDTAMVTCPRPAISGTGRFLVYETALQVLMIRDRVAGVVRPLQRGREPPNGSSRDASIAADGRYVAFASGATNLTDGPDANGAAEDVYVADIASMTFRRVAVSGFAPAISGDGRFVAFTSAARFDGAANGPRAPLNTYLHDLQTGATTKVSVSATGGASDGSSYSPAISGDGRYIAFVSEATNLVRRHDRSNVPQVYVRDVVAKVTELISRTSSGQAGNGASRHPVLSADGRIAIFQSEASNLTCDRCPLADRDINLVADIFRRDRSTGLTELISRGRTPWMEPSIGPAADRTGRIVAFASRHPLDQADDRHDYDLFVWTRELRR